MLSRLLWWLPPQLQRLQHESPIISEQMQSQDLLPEHQTLMYQRSRSPSSPSWCWRGHPRCPGGTGGTQKVNRRYKVTHSPQSTTSGRTPNTQLSRTAPTTCTWQKSEVSEFRTKTCHPKLSRGWAARKCTELIPHPPWDCSNPSAGFHQDQELNSNPGKAEPDLSRSPWVGPELTSGQKPQRNKFLV